MGEAVWLLFLAGLLFLALSGAVSRAPGSMVCRWAAVVCFGLAVLLEVAALAP